MPFDSIPALLDANASDHTALDAPGRRPMSYLELRNQALNTLRALNRFGVGRNDRVGMVLPNGPEAASAFVSVACAATCAPLNAAYRQEELEFYLEDLNAKALIVPVGEDSAATAAAQKLGIPLVEMVTEPDKPAGWFALQGDPGGEPARAGLAHSDDVALVLHTSGTTARPKIVPLTHGNVCASAANIAHTLRLTPQDRCLNVMPLFHIHGLIGAVLSSLSAGAQVICTPGFHAMRFFGWMEELQPSWYSAVPTMHQAILSRAPRNEDIIADSRLRLVRSSSAALPPQVLAELERTFRCPVVESYGMTEAAHQMAANPLPPQPRKPGTVGPAAGPEIAVMDDAGNLLPQGATGEVVIRGRNVTPGYDKNPEANAKSFTDGWFRTGDQGFLDEDGYLTISGRLKEIINRGGEKVSPREIDEVLLDHPGVAQAVTFGMPHDKLGEEIAAAVILREGTELTERELRDFAAAKLADFKVPRKILFLTEIPKGPTGKVQRIGLAAKLGLG
ncbi:MAG: AMP-binding protein [Acidobacteria bacterium]|nr:AMP-binding protein [Acidobacteriota bacterium]